MAYQHSWVIQYQRYPCRRTLVVRTYSWADNRNHTFLTRICPKMNTVAWREFELACYDVAVEYVNHYSKQEICQKLSRQKFYVSRLKSTLDKTFSTKQSIGQWTKRLQRIGRMYTENLSFDMMWKCAVVLFQCPLRPQISSAWDVFRNKTK